MPGSFSWDWYYNRITGVITQMVGLEASGLLTLGVIKGPFPTKQAAIDYYNQNKSAHPDWQPPTEPYNVPAIVGNTVSGADTAAKEQAKNAASGAVDKVLGNAANPGKIEVWFLRIGEILLGLVLIAVGVVGMTKVTNAAKTAGKAAIAAAV